MSRFRGKALQTSLDSETILSLDLGGTKLLGLIINRSADILLRRRYATPRGNEAVKASIIDLLAELLDAGRAVDAHPSGIAICAPGFLDSQAGVMMDAENLAVENLSLVQPVFDRFKLPTRLFHDVKAATLAEALFGAGRGRKNFAFLNIGTGVSVGLYLDGKVYQGATGKAGEIGHIALVPVGAGKPCGLDERLEMQVSGPAMAARAEKVLEGTPRSIMLELAAHNRGQVTSQVIEAAALRGDELALRVIEETADILGLVVGNLVDLLDLECIILGGGVARMGDLLLRPIESSAARYAIDKVTVLSSVLGTDAGAIGAAASFFCLGG